MASRERVRGMGQGNGFRPVGNAREAGTRQQASRRVPARTFSRFQLLWFIVFAGEIRGTVSGRACTGLSLNESAVRGPLIV